jgi:hypothetical protein
LPSRSDRKASNDPSGENAGDSDDFFPPVKSMGLPPRVSAIQISVSKALSSQLALRTTKATRDPSGESAVGTRLSATICRWEARARQPTR